jgi:hypothetical protein
MIVLKFISFLSILLNLSFIDEYNDDDDDFVDVEIFLITFFNNLDGT